MAGVRGAPSPVDHTPVTHRARSGRDLPSRVSSVVVLTRSAFDTRTERGRRQAERNPMRPAMLLPPGAFSDRPAAEDDFRRLCAPGTPRGRHALAVQRRLASGCAGWKRRPTAEEFYDAVRAERPTERQAGIIRMWGAEATAGELIEAWVQHAYTLRELVAAMHRANFSCAPRIHKINRWAAKS